MKKTLLIVGADLAKNPLKKEPEVHLRLQEESSPEVPENASPLSDLPKELQSAMKPLMTMFGGMAQYEHPSEIILSPQEYKALGSPSVGTALVLDINVVSEA